MRPPIPSQIPHVHRAHGVERLDPFAWMRDREDPEVIEYIEAENAFTAHRTAHLSGLRERLFDEMRVCNRRLNDLGLGGYRLLMARRKIIDNRNSVALIDQQANRLTSDVASTSGYENMFFFITHLILRVQGLMHCPHSCTTASDHFYGNVWR